MIDLLRHWWDTALHKLAVASNLARVCAALMRRAWRHDASKFREPEASKFAEVTSELSGSTYGSEEYERLLGELEEALEHHYAENSHHLEHHDGTVDSMPPLDVVEMLCDWEAASRRHDDGDVSESIEINAEDYDYDADTADEFRYFYREIGLLD